MLALPQEPVYESKEARPEDDLYNNPSQSPTVKLVEEVVGKDVLGLLIQIGSCFRRDSSRLVDRRQNGEAGRYALREVCY